jgi:hypothetical protein
MEKQSKITVWKTALIGVLAGLSLMTFGAMFEAKGQEVFWEDTKPCHSIGDILEKTGQNFLYGTISGEKKDYWIEEMIARHGQPPFSIENVTDILVFYVTEPGMISPIFLMNADGCTYTRGLVSPDANFRQGVMDSVEEWKDYLGSTNG